MTVRLFGWQSPAQGLAPLLLAVATRVRINADLDTSCFLEGLSLSFKKIPPQPPQLPPPVKAHPVADGGDSGGMDATRKDLSVPESNAQPVRDADETGIDVSLDTSLNTSRDVLSVSEAEAESSASRNRDILPLLKRVAGEWNAHLNRIADSCADIAARLGAIASESLLLDAQHEKGSIFGRTPSDAALAVAIVRHVRACDPGTLSAKRIRFQLEEEFACDLVTRIDFIRNHIQAALHDSKTASCVTTQAAPSDADEMVVPFQPQSKRRRADKTCIKDQHGVGRSTKRARSSSAVVAASLPPRLLELRSKNSDPFVRPFPKQVKSNQVSSYRFNASMSDAEFKDAFVHRL